MLKTDHSVCRVLRLGLQPYQSAWHLQDELAAAIAAGQQPPTLLLLQHPHTFTLGRSGDQANVLWQQAERAQRQVSLHHVDRGGDATYHGPGQLVGYPLLPLGRLNRQGRLPQADYIGYLRQLEQVIIQAVAALGLESERRAGFTGVWLRNSGATQSQVQNDNQRRKLASIGVKVDVHGISRHGFALNVDPDMTYWDGIVACGIHGSQMTSLAQHLTPCPTIDNVELTLIDAFSSVFGIPIVVDP